MSTRLYRGCPRAGVVVADPAWQFGDSIQGGRGAIYNYDCMSVREVMRFPLPPMLDDCLLLLWRVAAMQEEALRVMDTWGFDQKSELVWLKKTKTGKRHFGMGHYVRMEHEVCLIGVRGRPKINDRAIRSTFGGEELLSSCYSQADNALLTG